MPWFKVDDGFHGHPKVVELGVAAVGLWTLAGSWCAKYLTDGFVPDKTVTRLGGDHEQAAELVASGLWERADDGGYWFRDWADYQPLKVDVEAERAAAQERMRAVRAKKKGVRPNEQRTDDERADEPPANDSRSSEEVRSTPSQSLSHPSPIPPTPKGVPAKRGTRLKDSFEVSEEMVLWARERAPLVDGQLATERFKNHFMAAAGRGSTKVDWVRAWKNWLLSDQDKAASRQSQSMQPRPTAAQRNLATVAHFEQQQMEIEQ